MVGYNLYHYGSSLTLGQFISAIMIGLIISIFLFIIIEKIVDKDFK